MVLGHDLSHIIELLSLLQDPVTDLLLLVFTDKILIWEVIELRWRDDVSDLEGILKHVIEWHIRIINGLIDIQISGEPNEGILIKTLLLTGLTSF